MVDNSRRVFAFVKFHTREQEQTYLLPEREQEPGGWKARRTHLQSAEGRCPHRGPADTCSIAAGESEAATKVLVSKVPLSLCSFPGEPGSSSGARDPTGGGRRGFREELVHRMPPDIRLLLSGGLGVQPGAECISQQTRTCSKCIHLAQQRSVCSNTNTVRGPAHNDDTGKRGQWACAGRGRGAGAHGSRLPSPRTANPAGVKSASPVPWLGPRAGAGHSHSERHRGGGGQGLTNFLPGVGVPCAS